LFKVPPVSLVLRLALAFQKNSTQHSAPHFSAFQGFLSPSTHLPWSCIIGRLLRSFSVDSCAGFHSDLRARFPPSSFFFFLCLFPGHFQAMFPEGVFPIRARPPGDGSYSAFFFRGPKNRSVWCCPRPVPSSLPICLQASDVFNPLTLFFSVFFFWLVRFERGLPEMAGLYECYLCSPPR